MSAFRKLLPALLMFSALSAGAQAARHGHGGDEPGRFDYYAVALS